MENLKKYLDISEEVQKAMDEGKPIVALESTIISHGMPYPKNLETAKRCEEIVREEGAIPATTAIINGRIKVGLSEEELEFMAKDQTIIKASRRDYAYIVSKGLHGATTVATSIITARLAGIKMLVTGGIGGVHRGAEISMDISRDLQEIANQDILVVCAGAKSILDIELTLEYLETHGVTVYGYKTENMPAFYTRDSGYKLDYKVEDYEEVAEAVKVQWELGLHGGAVLANPIPEEYAMDSEKINEAITVALKEAEDRGIEGKEVTPFLLDRVLNVTGGESLEANIQLVENNARIGARVAKFLY